MTDLDDPAALTALDASDMLRAVATSAAQLRASATAVAEADLDRLDLDQPPRAVVVTGMGGSGISGDVLAAVAGQSAPLPIVVHRGYGLPGWVGASDLVIAVSCSGSTAETLSAAQEAARRRTRLLGVGSAESPLHQMCLQARGAVVEVTKVLSPRSSLWALSVPLLVVGARLGLLDLDGEGSDLEQAAVRLEQVAASCHPDRELLVNPAKQLASRLAGSAPVVWGSGQLGPVAAYRAVCQLAENAKTLAVHGVLPEAHHNQVVAFDNPAAGRSDDDIFSDPLDGPAPVRPHLLLVRDDGADDLARARAEVSEQVATRRGIDVDTVSAEGDGPVERLASLVCLLDFVSVYLALGADVDPSPIGPIDELKAALA